jgi:type IX secretion system PorP/SprF family membrane protein
MMKNLNYIGASIALISLTQLFTFAQDVHFSSMDYSPLTLNPGLAGAQHEVNATLNYRSQWNSISTPFTTIAAGADMRIKAGNVSKNGIFAAGINLYNDRAGNNSISTNNVGLSLAYHLKINQNSTIGLGLQAGFIQRTLDASTGMWSSQYNGIAYDPSISSGETFGNPSFARFDVGAGVVYSLGTNERNMRANDGMRLNAGYAVFHINRPSYSFFNSEDDPLYMRHAAFVNASFGISNTTMFIDPGVYFQLQGPSMEILIGADYKVMLSDGSKMTGNIKNSSVALGVFYRNSDAVVPRVIYTYSDFALGMSYDFNISGLSQVTRARGGVEFFFRWAMDGSFGKTKSRI